MCRKECKECPWINDNKHSLKFREYSKKMKEEGFIENSHKCHMIDSDVWGFDSNVNSSNSCIGSLKNL
jgi:hypothetical protein